MSPEQQRAFDDLEAFAIKALGRDRYDGEFLAQPLAGWVRMGYSAGRTRDAIQRAAVNAPANRTAQYVNGCLIKGRSEPEPTPAATPATPAKPATIRPEHRSLRELQREREAQLQATLPKKGSTT